MKRRLLEAGLALAAALVAAGIVLWIYRLDLVKWEVTRLLEAQGLGPATFKIDKLGLGDVTAHDVALRGGAIKAGTLTVSFSLRELLAGHLARVEIGQFTASLAMGKDGIEVSGQPLALGAGTSSGKALRIDALGLRDAKILFATPAGPIEATVTTTLGLANGEVHAADSMATIAGPVAGVRRKASIAAQQLTLQPQADGGLQLTVGQAAISPEGLGWAAQAIDGKLLWQPGKATIDLTVGRLLNLQKPALVAPLSLSATGTLAGQRLDFSLRGQTISKAVLKLQAKGWQDLGSGAGTANVVFGPVAFQRGGLQPGDLFPVLAGQVKDVDGRATLAGRLRWSAGAVTPDLTLKLENVAFAGPGTQIRQLNGDLKIVKLWPPASAPGQYLSATIETAGLPPSKLALTGQLLPKPALSLDRATLDIAGGEIVASAFIIDPALPRIQSTLQVNGVDLAEIFKLISIDGLTGKGLLDGPIPLTVEDGKVAIAGGKLVARGPGVISFRPGVLPPEIAQAGESVDLALKALANFHYTRLTLTLDKAETGEGTVLLQLQGNNPDLLSGQPFNFNIRIDSNFDRLAEYALLSIRSAEDLLRRAAGRTGP